MRQIKFRCWDVSNRRWTNHNFTYEELGDQATFNPEKAEYFILQQYTGLKDRNGVEVYEGDILHFKTYAGGGFATAGIDVYSVVEYGEFCVKNNTLYDYVGFYAIRTTKEDKRSIKYLMGHGATVVGNIYENPELCK